MASPSWSCHNPFQRVDRLVVRPHADMRWGNSPGFRCAPKLDRRFARGFSLTEMLVVLGIILIVSTLILTGALAARKAARQTLCLTQLHSIGIAVTNYSMRYQGIL